MIYLRRSVLRGMGEIAGWLVGRRQRVRVAGQSMTPTLDDGDFVLVDRQRTPAVGELALAHHPEQPLWVIKRVADRTSDGRFVVASDNPEAGTDSRTWGPVDAQAVLGTVTFVLGDGRRSLDRPNEQPPSPD